MKIDNVLAGIAVRDFARAKPWYEMLLGQAAGILPAEMAGSSLAEWQFSNGGALQLFADAKRAGLSSITLAVSDLDAQLASLRAIGVHVGPTSEGRSAKTAIVNDEEGNQIVFAQALSPLLAS
jgi:predicted enzyme related to lactoylglutathione lyase